MQLADGYKQTELGVIPEDWGVKQVAEVCGFIVPGRNKPRNFGGDIPWVTTPDLDDGGSVSQSRLGLCITQSEAQSVGSRIVPAGSVLMSCAGELGIVAYAVRDIVINQQLHAFLPTSAIEGQFLKFALKMRMSYIDSVATKTAVPYLNKDNCNSIMIPLPPLAEQRAIAEALSDVDALINALDALITKKRHIKQGTMQQLLTGKKRLPGFNGEWKTCCQRDVVTFINGRAYGKHEWETSGTPVCRLQNLTGSGDTFYYSSLKLPEKQYMESGDLIFMWSASFGPYIWQGPRAIYHYHIWKIECDPKLVDRRFYYHKLVELTEHLKATTDGSTMLHLTKGGMEKFQIKIPHVQEQAAIAEVLSDMDAEITALERKRDKTKLIKQGMMQELLTGKTRLITSDH